MLAGWHIDVIRNDEAGGNPGQKLLTAKFAKKGREGRKEEQRLSRLA
jgi:hypothetical protein